MESRFCVLSDTEDLQMLISNTAINLHNERWVDSRCCFIMILVGKILCSDLLPERNSLVLVVSIVLFSLIVVYLILTSV